MFFSLPNIRSCRRRPAVGASLERLSKQLVAAGVDVKRETRAPTGSRGLRSALRQAPERRHVGASAGQPASGNAGRGREDSRRRSKLGRRACARRRDEPSRMATGRFRATGPQTAMARPVPRLRRRHLSAGRDASLSARSFGASGSAEARCRRKGISLSATNWPGPNSQRPAACRRPSFPCASRTVCRSACKSSAPNYEDRTPLAFARAGRARVRRFHGPARLRIAV